MIKTTWSPLPKLDGMTWQRLHLPSVKSLQKLSQQYFSYLKIIPAYSRCCSRFFHCALICASLRFVLFLTDLLIVPRPSRCCLLYLLSLLVMFNVASLTLNRVTWHTNYWESLWSCLYTNLTDVRGFIFCMGLTSLWAGVFNRMEGWKQTGHLSLLPGPRGTSSLKFHPPSLFHLEEWYTWSVSKKKKSPPVSWFWGQHFVITVIN